MRRQHTSYEQMKVDAAKGCIGCIVFTFVGGAIAAASIVFLLLRS